MEKIAINRTSSPKAKTPSDKLGFGKVFSDYMFLMMYDEGERWHDPRIVPYGPIELMPCANVLHYAQEIFEGLKAYRTESGTVQLFGTKAGASLDGDKLEIYNEYNGYMGNVTLADVTLADGNAFDKEINHFVDCILTGIPCRNPAEDGVTLMKILDAIYESARTGHEVVLK